MMSNNYWYYYHWYYGLYSTDCLLHWRILRRKCCRLGSLSTVLWYSRLATYYADTVMVCCVVSGLGQA